MSEFIQPTPASNPANLYTASDPRVGDAPTADLTAVNSSASYNDPYSNARDDAHALKSDARDVKNDLKSSANASINNAADNVHGAAHNAKANANDAYNTAADNANDVYNDAADKTNAAYNNAADKTNAAYNNAADNVQDAAHTAKVNAQQTADQAKASAQNAKANVQQTAANASSQIQKGAQQASANAKVIADNANVKLHQVGQQVAAHPLVQDTKVKAVNQMNALDHELSKYPFLNEFEARTRVPKTYAVLGASALLALTIFFNPFGLASPATNFIGWVLPAIMSCHALETRGKNDDKQWLTYWIVFGYLNFIESSMLSVILYYVPRYYVFKLAFTVWLMLPATRGAEKVYYTALHPLFQQAKVRARTSGLYVSSPQTDGTFSTDASSTNPFTSSSSGISSGINTNPSTGYSSAGTTSQRLQANAYGNPTIL